jgi:hypothetical protein
MTPEPSVAIAQLLSNAAVILRRSLAMSFCFGSGSAGQSGPGDPDDVDAIKVLSFHPPPRRAAVKRGLAARGP